MEKPVLRKSSPAKKRITLIIGIAALVIAVLISLCSNALLRATYTPAYEKLINKYASEYSVDPLLIFAVIKTESGFDPEAVSSAGALGLMQMTEETFEFLTSKTNEKLEFEQLKDPEISIKYGTYYLSRLLKQFGIQDTALAAYNAGPTMVANWLEDREISADGENLDNIPFKETKHYVYKVNKYLDRYVSYYNGQDVNIKEDT